MGTPELEDQLVEIAAWRNRSRFGKYRGTVESVEEGDRLGYISAKVYEVFDSERIIENIRPCSPFAGSQHGFVAIPEEGDGVWVEFEAGDTSNPIWTGFWWADGAMPEPKGPLVRSFITTTGHKLILDDDGNEVALLHKDGAEMKMTDGELTVKIGDSSVTLTSSDITLQVGTTPTSPMIKIDSSEIKVQASTVGALKLTSGGVDIGNGAMKIGA